MEGEDRKWHELDLHWLPKQHSSEAMCTRLRLWHNIQFSFVSAVFWPLLCSLRGSFITPLSYVLTVDLLYVSISSVNILPIFNETLSVDSVIDACCGTGGASNSLWPWRHLCSMWCSVEKPHCCSQSLLEASIILSFLKTYIAL